jgi:phosphatidylserine/phosphatidylglycerophosphate/cardiolipin synthase-like enzyme
MTKNIILLFGLLLMSFSVEGQILSTILQARSFPLGTVVTVRGRVTNGQELGNIRYFQDPSAGLSAFPGTGSIPGFNAAVTSGDSIEITGPLMSFSGSLQISPITAFSVFNVPKRTVTPKIVGLAELGESFESQVVEISCLHFLKSGQNFSSSSTYEFSDPSGRIGKIFLRTGNPIIGTDIPSGTSKITTILTQFGDYQLVPRTTADFTKDNCFFINGRVSVDSVARNGFRFRYKTNFPSSALAEVTGVTTSIPKITLLDTFKKIEHVFWCSVPSNNGEIYEINAKGILDLDTATSPKCYAATISSSSGKMEVYFNYGVNTSFSNGIGSTPLSTTATDLENAIIAKIDAAKVSIDVSMYNFSRLPVYEALVRAFNRGVRIRYVADPGTSNIALNGNPPAPFPIIYVKTSALMHNKFFVIDPLNVQESWLIQGATNLTNQQVLTDYNNLIHIQDKSLALTYRREFEEMWGGTGPLPDTILSRAGFRKIDNTPHLFNIAGKKVECYFSPSDGTNGFILNSLNSSNKNLLASLLIFTKDDLADAIIAANRRGVDTRINIENTNNAASEQWRLVDKGIEVRIHKSTGILHHKYCVIDDGLPNSDPQVVNGSHNWSDSAENSNDENTLIIHDANIANMFRQEFEARWVESVTGLSYVENWEGLDWSISPNPARDILQIQVQLAKELSEDIFVIKLFSLDGKELKEVALGKLNSGNQTFSFDVSNLPEGNFRAVLTNGKGVQSKSLIKIN